MPKLHHVSLFVAPENVTAQESFMTEVLGCRKLDPGDQLRALGANWFQADGGTEIHIGTQPHAAIEFGERLADVEKRLLDAGIEFQVVEGLKAPDGSALRIVACKDPADNQWELRGVPPKA